MSTTLQSPPAPKTSALRRWFPLFAVALAVLILTVLWRLPEGTPERLIRSMVDDRGVHPWPPDLNLK